MQAAKVIAVVLGLMALAGCGTKSTNGGGSTSAQTGTAIGGGVGNPTAGKQVFLSAGCRDCHTLKAAGANGTVGPNLDERKPSIDKVVERLTNGKGVMPSFKGRLTPFQIKSVAAFVYASTH